MDIKDLKIREFRVNETLFSRILKILTPFSIYFWIAVFLFIVLILINKYIISNFFINFIYILICLVILLK